MTKLSISYLKSDEFRNREFIATGNYPSWYEVITFDLTQATPEERQIIASLNIIDNISNTTIE